MSKHKKKQARRESKRTETRKIAANHRKATAKPSTWASKKQNAPRSNPTSTSKPTAMVAPKPNIQASQRPPIPFGTYDNILLVGEGDFSFTHSLAIHHGCANVTATSFDDEKTVREKYPTFEAIHEELSDLTPPVPIHHSIDAGKLSSYKSLRSGPEEGGGREWEGWDTIAFMFPHTGGLSTDVNRQVRANQSLLVSFFTSCLETKITSKAPSAQPPRKTPTPFLKSGGRIIVTLFEGEPYTLWNIRDLARHAGLKVLESFRFEWSDYPGYSHVRTLGHIDGGGKWRGEEREARMYVFEKVDEGSGGREDGKGKKGKKRQREESGSDSEEG